MISPYAYNLPTNKPLAILECSPSQTIIIISINIIAMKFTEIAIHAEIEACLDDYESFSNSIVSVGTYAKSTSSSTCPLSVLNS